MTTSTSRTQIRANHKSALAFLSVIPVKESAVFGPRPSLSGIIVEKSRMVPRQSKRTSGKIAVGGN
jgi:hypothetical protein